MKSIYSMLLMCSAFAFSASTQDRPLYFVQFKITTVTSLDQAQEIDSKIASKKGIVSTHTDHITSTYFCTLTAETDYVFEDFEGWFEKLGYGISCFNKGIQGTSEVHSPHFLKNCEEKHTE